jgi:hypothetical protein
MNFHFIDVKHIGIAIDETTSQMILLIYYMYSSGFNKY